MQIHYENLVEQARQAAHFAYAPYSGYQVGAAILTFSGTIYRGCNVENCGYTLTDHAEAVAVSIAIADGELARALAAGLTQREWIKALACVCLKTFETWPCCQCRQTLCEWGTTMDIIVPREDGSIIWKPLSELAPNAYVPEILHSLSQK